MFKFLLVVSVGAALCAPFLSINPGTSLKKSHAQDVFKLTRPSNASTGGTGFTVRVRGRAYTVSNGHVCELNEGGVMAVHVPGTERRVMLRVLEISEQADLCLLEALPQAKGFQLSAEPADESEPLWVMGQPHLRPLTLSTGYYVGRGSIRLLEEEKDELTCVGPTRSMITLTTLFGDMNFCIRTVEAIETSIVIYPGNSGSPLLNESGEVVGVMFAGSSTTHYGSAVPLEILKDFLSVY